MIRARFGGKRTWIGAVALATGIVFAALDLAAFDNLWLRRLETATLDLRIRLRGPKPPGPETVIVLIDERAVAEIGRWPFPRRKFADLLDRLAGAGARVVAFDILFLEPEAGADDAGPALLGETNAVLTQNGLGWVAEEARRRRAEGDAQFAGAVARAGRVALPFTFRFDGKSTPGAQGALERAAFASLRTTGGAAPAFALRPGGVAMPIAGLADAAAALGSALVAYDVDGAPRFDYPVLEYDLDYYPSLPVRIAQLYLDVPWSLVSIDFARGISIGPVFVPTDALMRLQVNYRGPPRTFPTVPFSRVLDGKVGDEFFRNRIVLVGTGILGVKDTFETPFSPALPGVERLATLVDQILHGDHIVRPEAAAVAEAALILTGSLAIGLAVAAFPVPVALAAASGALALAALAAYIALAWYNLWFAAGVPLLGLGASLGASSFVRYGLLERENRRVRHAFGRYLAPQMVAKLMERPDELRLGGESRELTILFSDVRGFSAIAERLSPEELTRLVNELFTPLTDVILEHGGTVDKYIGDCVMAFWNAPVAQERHAEMACRAALGMVAALHEVNLRLAAAGSAVPPIQTGIGVNTGPCTVGNLGSAHRFDYSALGDAVNVASRLEEETKAYGLAILIGPETASRIPMLATLPVDLIRIRGRAQPLEIQALLGDERVAASPGFVALRQTHGYLRAACFARDWPLAATVLRQLQATAPPELQRLYACYAERLAQFLEEPPPPEWDGSFLTERRGGGGKVIAFRPHHRSAGGGGRENS